MDNITDIIALKKWRSLPDNIQQRLLNNVFCSNCKITTIVEYTVTNNKYGIVLKGKCKKCGGAVARVIEE